MTALGQITAGSRLTASMLRAVAPLTAYKSTDQPVTSSTTLVNDNALFVPVAASAVYLFEVFLEFEGSANGAGDLKFAWNAPTGATLRFQVFAGGLSGIGSPTGIGTRTQGTSWAIGTAGAGVLCAASMWGTLATATTAGNLQLQWAQNTSNTTPTIMHAASSVTLWQVG